MKVNGERVPDTQFEQEWQRLTQARQQDQRLQQMQEDQLRQMTMSNVLGQVLLGQEAKRRYANIPNKDVTKEYKAIIARVGSEKEFLKTNRLEKKDIERVKKDVKSRMQIDRLLEKLFSDIGEPTDKEVFDAYMKSPSAFGSPEQVHASHIVKHTNEGQDPKEAHAAIKEVKAKLDAGEDFEALAQSDSDCASGAQDLGLFPRGQMVQGFEDVVFKMEPDEISDIFKTEFGYHIAKVHEKRAATLTPFDDVKGELKQFMFHQSRNKKVDELVSKLREKATIED
jgi:parvulin-like peptidyl-prolyl isomerase